MVSSHVFLFPTLLLEDVLRKVGTFYSLIRNILGGKYVFTKCPNTSSAAYGPIFYMIKDVRVQRIYTLYKIIGTDCLGFKK